MKPPAHPPTRRRGYALLDVVLAVALFGITATGLMRVMQRISETSTGFSRDRYLQSQIEGLLSEKRMLKVDAMASEMVDELTGITFRTYVEALELDNGEGRELTGLYKLTAEGVFLDDGGEQTERAEIIIYKPET
jgi:hypothetical protein